MREVTMVFEIDESKVDDFYKEITLIFQAKNLKEEAELKSEIMKKAQITKAKFKSLKSRNPWKYPSNIY